jgi:hypothetical protein
MNPIAEHIAGLAALLFITVAFSVNGAVMLASPQRWTDLPQWVAPRSAVWTERIVDPFWSIVLRFTGLILLAAVARMLFLSLHH